MNRITNTLAGLSLTLLFFVASAQALSGGTRMVAYIPFEFTIGNVSLPAGQYQFERAGSAGNIIMVSDAVGHSQFAVPSAAIDGTGTSGESMLTFATVEGRHVLVGIWNESTQSGVGFAYTHEAERTASPEIVAARH